MYRVVLFDLDGTLTDPALGITNSVMYALSKYNIEVKERQELFKFIRPPLVDSFKDYYNFNESDANQAVVYYREYYQDKGIFENKLYDGIDKLLKDLKDNNVKIGLATSKPEVFARRILEHFNIIKYFDFIAGATLDGKLSKKVDIIKYALDNFSDNKKNIIMVGDRHYDILGAKSNEIDSIGVSYGYGSKDEFVEATYIANKVNEITDIVLNRS